MKSFALITYSGAAALVPLVLTAAAGVLRWRIHGVLAGFVRAAALAHAGLVFYKYLKTRPGTAVAEK
ncbi:MAG: hypothetical protein PHW69_04725 [Elusimicrobiaceae bacterium]|nr:hypothetical protein [Elusimicrobiaceae bacterium]